MSGRLWLLWTLTLVLVVVSAIQVVFSTHRVRELHIEAQMLQRQRDEALKTYSRLQLELAAIAAYQNIERTAEEKLDMHFPQAVERIDP
jgi:cell division protein FtsL